MAGQRLVNTHRPPVRAAFVDDRRSILTTESRTRSVSATAATTRTSRLFLTSALAVCAVVLTLTRHILTVWSLINSVEESWSHGNVVTQDASPAIDNHVVHGIPRLIDLLAILSFDHRHLTIVHATLVTMPTEYHQLHLRRLPTQRCQQLNAQQFLFNFQSLTMITFLKLHLLRQLATPTVLSSLLRFDLTIGFSPAETHVRAINVESHWFHQERRTAISGQALTSPRSSDFSVIKMKTWCAELFDDCTCAGTTLERHNFNDFCLWQVHRLRRCDSSRPLWTPARSVALGLVEPQLYVRP